MKTPFRNYTDNQLRDIARDIADYRKYGFRFEAAFIKVTNSYTLEGHQLQTIEDYARVYW